VLKSLWKSAAGGELTSGSSTELHALHNLGANDSNEEMAKKSHRMKNK
jgi:hypothetical protein